MIQLIFKRIFTQRKQNRWVVLSCFIISLLLFTMMFIVRDFYNSNLVSPKGVEADVENIYVVNLKGLDSRNDSITAEQRADALRQIKLKLEENHNVEIISVVGNDISMFNMNPIDTTKEVRAFIAENMVDYNFFRIFRPELVSGFDDFSSEEFKRMWTTQSKITPSIISTEVLDLLYYIEDYTERGAIYQDDKNYDTIVGNSIFVGPDEFSVLTVTNDISITPGLPRTVYTPLYESKIWATPLLYVKVKPGTDFKVDKSIEAKPYSVKNSISLEQHIDNKLSDNILGVFFMVALIVLFFLFYLIFGILGSFWQRTIQRTGDIGLQLALGATPLKIGLEMLFEAIILLLIAFIPAMLLAANQYYYDILTMDTGDAATSAITVGMFVENMLYTFLVMASMVVIGIAAPLFKALCINPARALMSKAE